MSKALVQSLLQDGMTAVRQGNVELARRNFAQVVQENEEHEYGWLWLSLVVASSEQAVYCLQRVLALNPASERAQSALQHLHETTGVAITDPSPLSPDFIKEIVEAVPDNGADPEKSDLHEISNNATLATAEESAEVRSFKKRIATGNLSHTGPLSLTDEWLPDALLPAVDDRAEESVARNPERSSVSASDPKTATDETDAGLAPDIERGPLNGADAPIVVHVAEEITEPAPSRGPAEVPQSSVPVTPLSEPAGPCILVVDDSQTVRHLVKITLSRLGFHVIEARDGFEALAQLANRTPDLILLDITMPRMDGYQVCRIIKENGSTRHIPVIMLSGKDGFFDKVKGRLAGATDYVTKPFEPGLLYTSIQAHLEK